MLVRDLIPLLDAELIYGSDDIDIREIHSGCGSDMMSDVLAFVKDQPVLLTGLCNPQVIRTAEMMDIMCLVFVRGKRPACHTAYDVYGVWHTLQGRTGRRCLR